MVPQPDTWFAERVYNGWSDDCGIGIRSLKGKLDTRGELFSFNGYNQSRDVGQKVITFVRYIISYCPLLNVDISLIVGMPFAVYSNINERLLQSGDSKISYWRLSSTLWTMYIVSFLNSPFRWHLYKHNVRYSWCDPRLGLSLLSPWGLCWFSNHSHPLGSVLSHIVLCLSQNRMPQ
jgi:hypothetical protein